MIVIAHQVVKILYIIIEYEIQSEIILLANGIIKCAEFEPQDVWLRIW